MRPHILASVLFSLLVGCTGPTNTGGSGGLTPGTASTCPQDQHPYGSCGDPDASVVAGCYASCEHEGEACPGGGTCRFVLADGCVDFMCPPQATCDCWPCLQKFPLCVP